MKKKLNNYAFIDGQNLYLAIQELGWKLDYKKFRVYLREKYAILKVLTPSMHNCSSLLTKIAGNKISFVSDLRKKLEYVKKEPNKDGTS